MTTAAASKHDTHRDKPLFRVAALSLIAAIMLATVAATSRSWRIESVQETGAKLDYAGARVGPMEMCYSLDDIELCYAYSKTASFATLGTTPGSFATVAITPCELRALSSSKPQSTQIPADSALLRFLDAFCDDRATIWVPAVQVLALVALFAAIALLVATVVVKRAHRRAVLLTKIAARLCALGAALELTTILAMTAGYGGADMGYGPGVYLAIAGLVCSCAGAACSALSLRRGASSARNSNTTELLV